MAYIMIVFHTVKPIPSEIFNATNDFESFLIRFRELSKNNSKFVVYQINKGNLVADFS